MKNDPEFEELAKRTAALPREINPPRDLWPGINAQLAHPAKEAPATAYRWVRRLGFAAAAAVLMAASLLWVRRATAPSWDVAALAGSPRVGAHRLVGEGKWRLGQWLETDAISEAKFSVGNIGEVRLEPNSRLRLLGTADTDHRLELARGTLHAFIWAPPRLFFVETPSATAIDLGCAYTLTVDDDGGGLLHVTSGYVALEHQGRQVLIPAGILCFTRTGAGPGTPFSEKTTPAFRDALQRFDFGPEGNSALTEILAHATPGDEITLWHLLSRVAPAQRAAVFDQLAAQHPPPSGITREGIISGDESMLALWAADLGLTPDFAAR